MNENAFRKLYRLAHDNIIPINLMVELLTNCNERCKHCYISSFEHKGLSTDDLKGVIFQFRKLGGLNLSFTGGEIFLRPDLFELIKYARSLYLRVFLLTNGTLIDEDVAKRLKELNVAELSISLYSMDEAIHDEVTGVKNSLKRTLRGISFASKYNIPIVIKTPIMTINKDSYRDVKKFCDENNYEFIASALIFSKNDGCEKPKELNVSGEELKKVLKDIKEYEPIGQLNNFDEACGSLKYTISIDSLGNIYPCNSFYYKLGNIKEMTLDNVWKSEKLKKVQNIMKSDLKKCNNCDLKNLCNRCPGLAYLEDNDMFGCSSSAMFIAKHRIDLK